ncbi:glycosyltransferase [Parathalassolituus penaei]|uniref:Glycosyltransferase n=1 Tax=Parathalassolituus penaei TaxID=2997323 RepID=A0A9X3EG80_9GAMM|nr:glycosyltransferase [Parathalassolituus penaei]MCY0966944.1 glycosyltransferase [Parathalassolituus penaei]
MNISFFTPSISRASGGVGPAVISLANKLVRTKEIDSIYLKTLFDGSEVSVVPDVDIVVDFYSSIRAKDVGLSVSMILASLVESSDLTHSHGMWMATTMAHNLKHLVRSNPFILSPHGMLDPWILQRSAKKKKLARIAYENYSWRHAACFHALNESEADSIKSVVPGARIEVIPNGMDFGVSVPCKNFSGILNILFLGRLHEKKNLHALVSAVNSLPEYEYKRRPFVLSIAGWGDVFYQNKIESMIASGHPERFRFIGPVFGAEKEALINDSHAFLLPSFSEGLPVAILEAWANGLIVLKSEFCNLKEAFGASAALDCGTTEASILAAIRNLTEMTPSELNRMSAKGFDYACSRYSWDLVTGQFISLYREILK